MIRGSIGIVALLGFLACSTPGALAQFVDPGNSPGENTSSPGARRPGLLVQAGIVRHQQGPEITDPAIPDPNFRRILLNDLLQNIFAQLNVLIPILPGVLFPQDGAGGGDGGAGGGGGNVGGNVNLALDDVVMTEIAHNGNVAFVELLNITGVQISVEGFRFSDGINTSPALPSILMFRDETIVVQLAGETQSEMADIFLQYRLQSVNSGELALYNFRNAADGAFPIDDPNAMLDYVQWNNDIQQQNLPLEATASAANLWSTVDFVQSSLTNMSFRLNADAERRNNTRSQDIVVVPFAENTLGSAEGR